MRIFTVYSILLLISLCILGYEANPELQSSPSTPTYIGALHEFVINDWEAFEFEPVTGELMDIGSEDLLVIAQGMVIAPGDSSTFKFKFDESEYAGALPAIKGVSWTPLLVSEKPNGKVHNPPFIVVLKKTVEEQQSGF